MIDRKYYFHRTLKWMRRFTLLLNSVIFVIGVILILIGVLYYAPRENAAAESICIGIGCSLIASGIVAFVIYPSLESKEQINFHEIHDEMGLQTIKETGNLLAASGSWVWPKKNLDLITDRIDDLGVILNENNPIPSKLQIRIITKQPSLLSETKARKIRELGEWAKNNANHVQIKYYSNLSVPYYCLQDYKVTFGHINSIDEDSQRYIYSYYSDSTIGNKGQRYFDVLWENHFDYRIVDTYSGRSSTSQSECIEKVLQYFCRINKDRLELTTDIEAVIVIWTENKKVRRTFFSCNKGPDKGKHNMRAYADGVVGLLQKVLANDVDHTDGLLLYDYEKEKENCEYITNIRTEEKHDMRVKAQTWQDKATKAMLAISLFRDTNEGPQMYGALTFDFAETLKEKTPDKRKELFSSIRDCRDILLPFLATNIVNDYEAELTSLQKVEATNQGEYTIKETLVAPDIENSETTESQSDDHSSDQEAEYSLQKVETTNQGEYTIKETLVAPDIENGETTESQSDDHSSDQEAEK